MEKQRVLPYVKFWMQHHVDPIAAVCFLLDGANGKDSSSLSRHGRKHEERWYVDAPAYPAESAPQDTEQYYTAGALTSYRRDHPIQTLAVA